MRRNGVHVINNKQKNTKQNFMVKEVRSIQNDRQLKLHQVAISNVFIHQHCKN